MGTVMLTCVRSHGIKTANQEELEQSGGEVIFNTLPGLLDSGLHVHLDGGAFYCRQLYSEEAALRSGKF